jgi:hypothetical protein
MHYGPPVTAPSNVHVLLCLKMIDIFSSRLFKSVRATITMNIRDGDAPLMVDYG